MNKVDSKVKEKVMAKAQPIIKKVEKIAEKKENGDITYEDKVLINNLRAYLYSTNGVGIYDEPQHIIDQDTGTYLVITHHGTFSTPKRYQLEEG